MSILEASYVICAFIALYGYWTQIYALLRPSALLISISLKTYSIWTITTFVALLYSVFENGDIFFILTSACHFICSLSIAALIIIRRKTNGMPILLSEKASLDTLKK